MSLYRNMAMIPNKLWVRLTLAFGLVIIIAVVIAALLINYQVSIQFRRFVMHDQMGSTLGPALIEYYAANGTWVGVETVFDNRHGQGGMGQGMQYGRPRFILTDASGRVVYNEAEEDEIAQLNSQDMADAVPLEWQNRPIGYLLAGTSGQTELTGPAQAFLNQTNRSLLQAGLIAGGLGVLMSVAIAWGISAPLGRLAAATRRISQGQLDQRVPVTGANEFADLAGAFNEMAANLQQAETLRRNLVADIAHELRTPLSVIQGNLQAILDDIYPLEKAEIASIYDETMTLNRLVNDLRELAQAEAGQLSLNIQAIEIASLIEGVVDRFTELAREQGVNLEINLPANLPFALADPDRVQQVWRNLLANALRHTPEGGKICVLVELQPVPPTKDAASFIRVSVTDTGPGISTQDLPHIFDRFWRADKSRSREQGRSGLGLAIARQLIEAQGGQIGVKSDGVPGRGSCFWFTLPVAPFNDR